MNKYPTPWQQKTMWAALTALFVVFLVIVVGAVIWIGANIISFLQPILIPVAIALILAYLLDPLVTKMCKGGLGRTKAVALIFAIIFLALGGLVAWIVPTISLQGANFAKELPGYTQKARDRVVDLIFRYDRAFGMPSSARGKSVLPTTSFVNWLLGSPPPRTQATATNPRRGGRTNSPSRKLIARLERKVLEPSPKKHRRISWRHRFSAQPRR